MHLLVPTLKILRAFFLHMVLAIRAMLLLIMFQEMATIEASYVNNSGGHGNFRPRNSWNGNNGGFNNASNGSFGFGNIAYNNFRNPRHINNNNFHGESFDHSYYTGMPRISCQICGKPGHSAQTCLHLNKHHFASSSAIECQLCGNSEHIVADYVQRQQFSDLQTSHNSMIASVQSSITRSLDNRFWSLSSHDC